MFSTPYARSLWGTGKRLRISPAVRSFTTTPRTLAEETAPPSKPIPASTPKYSAAVEAALKSGLISPELASQINGPSTAKEEAKSEHVPIWPENLHQMEEEGVRLPRSVQAVYLKPLKREAQYGIPSCDLQLRSFSVRNVEFFADFAMRAAYYLGLPAKGPIPLPKITERWTTIRGHFVHAKQKENFERITLRRLIQIQDGHPEVVQTWLAFLQKHAYHGVGMKANVWEFESFGVSKRMDSAMADLEKALAPKLALFGKSTQSKMEDTVSQLLETQRFKDTGSPMTYLRKAARPK